MTLEDDEWRYMQEQEILGDYPRLTSDYYTVCDLLLDAYLCGFNSGAEMVRNGFDTAIMEYEMPTESVLTELVTGANLDPKKVLRRLYCPQQTEENGECSCD